MNPGERGAHATLCGAAANSAHATYGTYAKYAKYATYAVHAACAAVIAGVVAAATPTQLPAQGTISGTVSMLERARGAHVDLATAIVFLSGGPADARRSEIVPDRATIAMRGREFIPHVVRVRSGGSVAFPNQDPFSHNVFSNTEAGGFDLGLYRRGKTRSATFQASGIYPIFCNIHVRMVSFVVAVPTRFATTVDRDGRFRLPDVAPGTYQLHVWHERAPEVVQGVVVSDSEAIVRVTLDARGYVSGNHLNKFGLPYAATRTDRYE